MTINFDDDDFSNEDILSSFTSDINIDIAQLPLEKQLAIRNFEILVMSCNDVSSLQHMLISLYRQKEVTTFLCTRL